MKAGPRIWAHVCKYVHPVKQLEVCAACLYGGSINVAVLHFRYVQRASQLRMTYALQVTQRTVRDKFAVLSQMGTLLSLESVSEVMDYWDSNTTWRLTDAQVKEILGQRADFDPLEIASLDL